MRFVNRWFYLVSLGVWGFLGLFLLFFVSSASAAGVTYQTTRVGPGSYVPNGISVPTTVNVVPPAGVPRYQQVVPTMPKSRFGTFARAAVRGPTGLAAMAVIEGLGYLIDQATGDIYTQETEIEVVTNGTSITSRDTTGFNGQVSQEIAQGYISNALAYQYNYIETEDRGDSVYVAAYGWNCPSGRFGVSGVYSERNRCYTEEPDITETIVDVPATQPDLLVIDEALWDQLSLAQKNAIINDVIITASPRGTVDTSQYPVSVLTSPNTQIQTLFSEWPELRVAYQNMLNAEIAAYLASQDPEFVPDPNEQVIIDQGTTEPPMEPPVNLELPSFCQWAEFICRPFVGGDHPDVPTIDLEIEDYDSELPGDASCPAPYTFETGFTGPIEISFQPACDLAAAIRVPLLAISYLMAGFIVVGVRR